MMYSRAQRPDFDSWKTKGWSADEMLPYLKKLETYHGDGPKDKHGFTGPMNITGDTYRAERPQNDFIQAAEKVGYPAIPDLSILDANNGVSRVLRYVGTDGKRQDTASRYLRPRLESGKYPNLHVVVNSYVKRVLFENKRASGVEYVPEGKTNPSASPRTVKARKLVVVSSGALGTPSVLERSGVGRAEILQKAGIPIVAEVPGVGDNYQDHPQVVYTYLSSLEEHETIDKLVRDPEYVGKLMKDQAPILGWNAMDIQSKIRPTDPEVAELGPEFRDMWNKEYKSVPEKPLSIINVVNGFPGDPSQVPAGQYFAVSTFPCYPYARGSIHITGPEINNSPSFRTGFLSDPQGLDLKQQVWGYKKQREIIRRMKTYRGELVGYHPQFAADSNAALAKLDDSPPEHVTDIVYTPEDDKIIEDWVRAHVATTWHSIGTAKMAPLEEGGVVDATLSVYGVQNLKVADLSIAPLNVAANTVNTAIAIGEKAADIFIKELGLA